MKKFWKCTEIAVASLFLCCKGGEDNRDVITIDIEKAFYKAQEMLLSDFVEHIEYVALDSEKPINKGLKVYSSGGYLVCITSHQVYLFERQTGTFIGEMGRVGRGPGEYSYAQYFDSGIQHVVAVDNERNVLAYDLMGKGTRTISPPRKENEHGGIDDWNISGRTFIDSNSVVYFNNNRQGDAKDRLIVADESGTVFKIFSNPNHFVPQMRVFQTTPPIFYHYGRNTFFLEICIDTIFHVTSEALVPHYHLNMGKYQPPYELQNMLFVPQQPEPLINQYFWFRNIGETDHFLFFNFEHQKNSSPSTQSRSSFFGYFDKIQKSVKIADCDINQKHIVNDVDGFKASQLSSWTIDNEQNKLISYIEAIDIVEWFAKNPIKAKELPQDIQKLSKLQPDDNPVVVIAALK